MPIYAYRCDECGFSKDVLQKISDPVLTDCVSCGKPAFKKQLTAAGFQLKGTGWYVTDFRGGNKPATGTATPGASAPAAGDAASAPAAGAAASPAPAATPAAPASSTASSDKSTK